MTLTITEGAHNITDEVKIHASLSCFENALQSSVRPCPNKSGLKIYGFKNVRIRVDTP